MAQIETTTKYMTGSFPWKNTREGRVFRPIRKVGIIKETEKSITIAELFGGPYCYHKRLQSYQFHDTFEEAHQYLVDKAKQDIAALTNNLHKADEMLARVQALRAA